jgi:hypothetical protein
MKSREIPYKRESQEMHLQDAALCSELTMLYMLLETDKITVAEFNFRRQMLMYPEERPLS